jgi:molybdopterin converting factor small subunit
MNINVLFFGQLAEITGKNELQYEGIQDTEQLISRLLENYPALRNIRFACAVDQKIVNNNTTLSDKSIVALLPPFSGG